MSLRLGLISELSGAELAQHIEGYKSLIEGYHNTIGCIRSTLANPQFVEHSVAQARAMIVKHQQHIDTLLDQQAHGHERIEAMQARIVEAESDLATLFNFAKIVQFAEQSAKLAEALGSTRMDIVEQLMQTPQPQTI